MKISFSTLGCPEWTWEDMVVTAKDLGFNGIEIRGIENEIYVPKAKPFLNENLHATLSRLERLDLGIPCLTSSCYLFDRENINMYKKEGNEYIDIAAKLGTPFIRVLGDRNPEPGSDIDLDFVADNLKKLAVYAGKNHVKVLIETNGVLADSGTMLELLKKADDRNIGVLWDVHHPYRYFNEKVEDTYKALKDHIKFVHVKDSKIENGKVRYKLMGNGDVPVLEALQLLKKDVYDGFVSLEWVKRWCIDLEEPGIVFSHFINYIKSSVE